MTAMNHANNSLLRVPLPPAAGTATSTKDGAALINVTGMPKDDAILAVLRFLEENKPKGRTLKIVAGADAGETPLSEAPILMAAVEQLLRTRHIPFDRPTEGSFCVQPQPIRRSDNASSTSQSKKGKSNQLPLSINRMQAAKRAADRLRHGQPAEEPSLLPLPNNNNGLHRGISNANTTSSGAAAVAAIRPLAPLRGRRAISSGTHGTLPILPNTSLPPRSISQGSRNTSSEERPTMMGFQRLGGIRRIAPEENSQDEAVYEQALQQAMDMSRQQQQEEEERLRRALNIACGDTNDNAATEETNHKDEALSSKSKRSNTKRRSSSFSVGDEMSEELRLALEQSLRVAETKEQSDENANEEGINIASSKSSASSAEEVPQDTKKEEADTPLQSAHRTTRNSKRRSSSFSVGDEVSEELKLALEQSLQQQKEEEQELADVLQSVMKASEAELEEERQKEQDMMEQALLQSMMEFQERRQLSRRQMNRALSGALSQRSLYYFE